MTYKYVKNQDSEIMRNFIKVAADNGVIEDESIPQDMGKLDLSASDSVQENLLKLCAGLRSSGFSSYASKIEDHILTLKAAEMNELYNQNPDAGEKMMDEAHPEGDVQVSENGVVHTKITQHEEILDVVTKANLINSLKIALAFDEKDFPEWAKLFSAEVKKNIIDPLNQEPYYSAKVDGGKFEKVKDYFSSALSLSNGINDIPSVLAKYSEAWKNPDKITPELKRTILGSSAQLMNEYVFDLLAAIERAIKHGSESFNNKNYATQAFSKLSPLREMFNAIFAANQGDLSAKNYHSNFLSYDYFSNVLKPTNEKLKNVIFLIDRYVLNDQDINKYSALKNWFIQEKAYVTKLMADLSSLSSVISLHESQGEKVNRSTKSLFTLEDLKAALLKIDPEMSQDFDLSSVDSFIESVKKFPEVLKKDCADTVRSGITDENLKTEMLSAFEV